MAGVTIRHRTDRNCVRVTPLMWQPLPVSTDQPPKVCNTCQIVHHHKAIHFWLGPQGEAIVAKGIWDLVQKVGPRHGMDHADGFELVSEVKQPPPLMLGGRNVRSVVDNRNRAQVIYSLPHTKEARFG